MIEYHKIQSVFMRDPATKHRTFLLGQYAEPAFEYLANNEWAFTEKIDGTNVRVHWGQWGVMFGGRTAEAQMPVFLMQKLQALFTTDKLRSVFPNAELDEHPDVMLFGEGYGAKIQKAGGLYIPDGVDFILFDVLVGSTYLERHNVEDVANKLNIKCVPVVCLGTLADAIDMARTGFTSQVGNCPAEGLVMRPVVELRDRQGHRIITKVKHRDFVEAK